MKTLILVFCLIIFFHQVDLRADSKIDSLETVLKSASGKNKIPILIEICDDLKVSNLKQLKNRAEELLALAQKYQDKPSESSALSFIGTSYDELGNFEEAIKYHQKALSIAEDINDKKRIALSLNNIGIIYNKFDDYEKAESYYTKSYEINKQIKNKNGMAYALNNLATVYSVEGKEDKALESYREVKKIADELHQNYMLGRILGNIGMIYHSKKEYDSAMKYYRNSIYYFEDTRDTFALAAIFESIASISATKGDSVSAINYFNRSLGLSRNTGNRYGMISTYNKMSEFYELFSDYKKSLDYFRKYIALKDSITSEQNKQYIEKLQLEYETEKKAKEIALLKKDQIMVRNIVIFTIIVSFLAIGITILIYGRFKQKQKANLLLTEKNELITKQKDELTNTLNNLRVSEEKLRAILDNAVVGIGIVNTKGDYNFINNNLSDLLGYEKSELLEMNVKDITYSYDKELTDNYFDRIISKEIETYHVEKRFIKKDGTIFWCNVSISPIFDTIGNVTSIIGVIADIDDRKIADKILRDSEAKLRELNSAKDKFFSIIAHDLRTPILWFKNLSEILSRRFNTMSEEKMREITEAMEETAKESYHLIENLLSWSRSQAGRIEYKPDSISIIKLIEDNLNLINLTAKNKEIEISTYVEPGIKVFADKNMLKTVIRNLLSNAVKFTPIGGKIIISCEDMNGEINLRVKDNGVGISESDLEKIFRYDIQFSTPGTAEEKGTGLGLLLCKEFVDINKGKLKIISKPAEGTEFNVILTGSLVNHNKSS